MIGVRLGPFELLEPLGAGAFAEVWRAAHPSGEHVAVKVAREGSAVSWEEAVRLAQLDHPGVVHVYDHGTWEGRGWIAMELARGTLRALESPLPLADLAAHLLRAVAHLHARGIVHRDIKPSNILVGCAPRSGLDPADRAGVRLADLGISWSGAGRGGSSGTPGWAPPEQLRGMTHPSGDVYGVALVVRALATPADQARLAGWLARATAASPGERFPSAAHALAAFPDAGTTVLVGLPRDDAAGTEVAPELGIAETATRPVLLALDVPSAPMEPPAPVVEPAWPSAPPVPPYRRARVGLLDVGLALLPWRPVLPIGRLDLLLALWEALGHGSLALSGDEDDVDEVIGLLRTWVAETGLERDIRHDPEGVRVPPLDGWHLAARLEALGFEASTARVLASGCRTPRELRARVLSFVRADLVQVRPDGLHIDLARVLPAPSDDPADVERALDEAFWRGDLFALASGIPTLQRLVGDDPRLPLVVALARARAEKRRDLATADQLASDAEAAGALGDGRLRAGLYLEAAGTAVRARDPARVREIVALAGQVGDERLAAGLLLTLGFAGYMDGGEDAEPTVRRAAEMAEGRFRSMALSTLCDLRLKAGRPQDALDFALEALACHPPDRPDEELAIRGSVVLAYQTLKADESLITEQLEAALRVVPRVSARSSVARLTLFRAQQAMRLKAWDRADRLLAEAQDLFLRSGGSATFIVLNHGLVGLHRGDLASIAAVTPAGWSAEVERAPAYVRPLMLLHDLYASLAQDEASVDRAFASLEGVTLPPICAEGLALAAELAPRYADRLRALEVGT